ITQIPGHHCYSGDVTCLDVRVPVFAQPFEQHPHYPRTNCRDIIDSGCKVRTSRVNLRAQHLTLTDYDVFKSNKFTEAFTTEKFKMDGVPLSAANNVFVVKRRIGLNCKIARQVGLL